MPAAARASPTDGGSDRDPTVSRGGCSGPSNRRCGRVSLSLGPLSCARESGRIKGPGAVNVGRSPALRRTLFRSGEKTGVGPSPLRR